MTIRIRTLAVLAQAFCCIFFITLFLENKVNARPPELRFDPLVIYGEDNRQDLHDVSDESLLRLANSTVALFRAKKVTLDATKNWATLTTKPYGKTFSLCQDEPFYDQPMGSYCSGSLVGPDLILTAGHCIESTKMCQETKFVFGFSVTREGEWPTRVPADEVYDCLDVVDNKLEQEGSDYALIRLSRPVTGHTPLQINRSGEIALGTPLVVMGHPSGLPLKIAGGAKVLRTSSSAYFYADLDTYGGNSGSAIFNANTGLIEGILVRGETDFIKRGSCTVSRRCGPGECRGETATRISEVAHLIP